MIRRPPRSTLFPYTTSSDLGDDVRLEDVPEVALLDAAVPDVVGIHDHHRAVPALREAAGLVDPDVVLEAGLRRLAAKVLHEPLDVALGRAGIAPGAHEDVDAVLTHQSSAGAVARAAFRSATNRSTSSRIAFTISFSATLRMTSPFLKMRPIPRPPATPMSAARASPGPLTSQLCSMAPGTAKECPPSTSRLCTCPF